MLRMEVIVELTPSQINSFEQLCINYTNERLQQFFNHHMFVLEQEEYRRESIEWEFVNFGLDLQPTIDLIESTGNTIGILSCLDEECIMPKATEATFTHKLNVLWASETPAGETPHLGKSKYAPARFEQGFTVQHYAGKVEYRTDGWLEKNKNPLNDNLTLGLSASSERYVPGGYMDGRKACLRMINALDLDSATFRIGTSKIFFKAGVLAELEERRDGVLFDIFSRLQAVARKWTARRQMKKILNRAVAIRTIQRNARVYGELKEWGWWQLYTKVCHTHISKE